MTSLSIGGKFAVVCCALLAHPAGLTGQDSLSAPVVRVVSGDPAAPGPFVVRITYPPRFHTEPHHHSVDITGRVLRGRLLMGSGSRFDTTQVVPVAQGSSKLVRAGEIHFDWWPEGGELEIEGVGPMETVMNDGRNP